MYTKELFTKNIPMGQNGHFDLHRITDKTQAVYILYGSNREVLYVGYTEQLFVRLKTHLNNYKNEIEAIDYITDEGRSFASSGNMHMRELEKVLYSLLRPKYCKKKIIPETLYHVRWFKRKVKIVDKYEYGDKKTIIKNKRLFSF
jgi:hypothetical protein